MMDITRMVRSRIRLSDTAEHINVASYLTEDTRNWHLGFAAKSLMLALADEGATHETAYEDLHETIRTAIDSVHDLDVTFDDYASAVLAALIANAVPGYLPQPKVTTIPAEPRKVTA